MNKWCYTCDRFAIDDDYCVKIKDMKDIDKPKCHSSNKLKEVKKNER